MASKKNVEMIATTNKRRKQRDKVLTNRELQILELYQAGKSEHEIADTLMIQDTTLGTHKKHILGKLGLHSTQALRTYELPEQSNS